MNSQGLSNKCIANESEMPTFRTSAKGGGFRSPKRAGIGTKYDAGKFCVDGTT